MTRKGDAARAVRKAKIEKAAAIGPLHEAAARRQGSGASGVSASRMKEERSAPLAITGLTNPKRMTLDLEVWFDKLEVDSRYQRPPVPTVVNGMEQALRAGGICLAPIVLAKRQWSDECTKAGVLYIVDGQQRTLAHVAAEKKLEAVCYDSVNLAAERQAFAILNMTARKVSANKLAHAFAGPAFELLRTVSETPGHPLYGRVLWYGGNKNKSENVCIEALSALKGLGALIVGLRAGSEQTPAKLFPKLNVQFQKHKAEDFFDLLGQAVGERCTTLYAVALGTVARERWIGSAKMPTPKSLDVLRRTDWRTVARGSVAMSMLPVVVEAVKRKWK